jgi:hypothetical protein
MKLIGFLTGLSSLCLHYFCTIIVQLLHFCSPFFAFTHTASCSDLLEHLALIYLTAITKYSLLFPIFLIFLFAPAVAASDIVDNPWGVCLEAANVAGIELANTLLGRLQGSRPVTLVGYSMGALVITCALKEMARRSHSRGIVQSVYVTPPPPPPPPPSVMLLSNTPFSIFFLFKGSKLQRAKCFDIFFFAQRKQN